MADQASSTTVATQPNKRGWLSAFALDLTPLKASREYRLLYFGQFVSAFGSAISYVVLPWQMYQLTRSSFYVGLLGVAEFVPMFVLAFVGGALADAFDRRRLVMLTEAAMVLCCTVLVANSLLPRPNVALLFAMAALFAACNALHRPAHEALTPRLVPPEQIPAVGALSMFRFSITFIVGSSLAGLITSKLGASVGFALDGLTFLASLSALGLMKPVPPPEAAEQPSLQAVKEAWGYARSRQELLGTYLIDINAMFFGMPMALFPAIAEQFGPNTVGMFYATPAIGALLVTLFSGWTDKVQRHGLAVVLAAIVWGLAIVGFGLTTKLWLALIFLIIAFGADAVSGIFRMTIWNQTIPDHLRGRMASIEMISYSTGPYLGNAEAGLAASLLGLRASVALGGALCVTGCVALALCLPRFIRYKGREGIAQKQAEEAARMEQPGNKRVSNQFEKPSDKEPC
jgi:MFS family permease